MKPEIVDLRTGSMEAGSLGSQLFDSLSSKEKRLEADGRASAQVVLYDNVGLEMYPEVANLEAYYLFKDELDILKRHGDDIAARMMGLFTGSGGARREEEEKLKQNGMNGTNGHGANGKLNENGKEKWGDDRVGANNYGVNGSLGKMNGCDSHLGGPAGGGTVTPVVVELGAGSAVWRRPAIFSPGLHKLHIPGLKYYALDLEKRQLVQTLSELTTSFPKVATAHPSDPSKISVGGICADYFQGLKWLSSGGLNNSSTTDPPKCLLHLGSSLGNFSPTSAISFLSRISELFRPGVDKLLICLDGCQDATKIERAYNDEFGKTAAWFQNGWRNAGFNAQEGRHEAYMRLREGGKVIVTVEGEEKELEFKEGELVNVEVSYKLTEKQAREMFRKSGLRVVQVLEGREGRWGDEYAEMGRNLPSMEEWRGLWKLWDEVTLNIIPKEMLHEKPIDLRHINLFYLVRTYSNFLGYSSHESAGWKSSPNQPISGDIFERGIDPDMEDPTKIHRHSKVPKVKEDWPTLEEILAFRDAVRKRVETIYDEKKYEREGGGVDRAFGRSLWLGYEHEAMHLETILYMIVQMAPEKINPSKFSEYSQTSAPSQIIGMLSIPSSLNFGIDDVDTRDNAVLSPSHVYGWDNESPTRIVEVKKPFKISLLMITNGDYYDFWKQEPGRKTPESWKVDETGNVSVKTGLWARSACICESLARHWSKGGRLPTEFELQMLYDKYPINPFTSNVDFQTWHPVPTTVNAPTSGGVWEWTCTAFDLYDGFVKSRLYPEYSEDFFVKEGQVDHWVVKGGSWGTVKRIATRREL
ncbi:hypothetical protein BT69DRAFT_1333714 [Atractiella rhizophila]|nr:hypothetical protein BT69DRAFT_1333714 [Atractiella rhizophila]